MEVRLASLIEGAKQAEGTVVVLDVFRAFTTSAVAFSRGAEKIILVAEIEEALELRSRLPGALCMGEVDGIRPESFDLGNSPFELSTADVEGRTLIQSTRSGTVGAAAADRASRLYVCSLVVARAMADVILRDRPELTTIVAMGSWGKSRSDEDEQCALYLRNLIQGRQPDKDAVRSLILASGASMNFDDPALQQYHPMDREIALRIDSVPIAMPARREEGLLVVRAEVP